MSDKQRPMQPVTPSGMELIFIYRCPKCGRKSTLIAPTQPGMVACDACGQHYPIVPVDENSIHFVKIMLDDGRAAADPNFL